MRLTLPPDSCISKLKSAPLKFQLQLLVRLFWFVCLNRETDLRRLDVVVDGNVAIEKLAQDWLSYGVKNDVELGLVSAFRDEWRCEDN